MSIADCLNIPECIWIEIFNYLDIQSLLRITETCQLFATIFVSSSKLLDKVRIKVNINDDVPSQLQILMNSQRTYRNLFIGCDETLFNRTNPQLEGYNLHTIREIFGKTVTSVKLKNIFTKIHSLIDLLKSFVNLRSCTFEKIFMSNHSNFYYNLMDERDQEILKNNSFPFTKLEELVLVKSDFFCFYFFQNVHCLKKLIVNDLGFDIIDPTHFENFLMKQIDLKELRLRKFRDNYIFTTSLLASAPFQLETLSMNSVYWKDKDNGTAFFKNQRKIKTFEVALKNRWNVRYDEVSWFNDILKHVFTNNKDLKRVTISTMEKHGYDIRTGDFLDGIVCPKVNQLTYCKGGIDKTTTMMALFVKLFPNVNDFTFNTEANSCTPDLSFLSFWKRLESLAIKEDMNCLKDVYAPNLINFEFDSFGRYSDDLMKNVMNFIERHPLIRRFKLHGVECGQGFE